MKVDVAFLSELTIRASNFEKLAVFFDLTESQKIDPQAADYIIDRIKQIQTAYFIRKAQVDKANFPTTQPDPPKLTPFDIKE